MDFRDRRVQWPDGSEMLASCYISDKDLDAYAKKTGGKVVVLDEDLLEENPSKEECFIYSLLNGILS